MISKILTTCSILILGFFLSNSCYSAPIQKTDSDPVIEIKQTTSHDDDVEQFYKDQEHLLPFRKNDTTPVAQQGNLGQIITQVWNPNGWIAILSQFGIQRPDFTTIQGIIIGLPFEFINQFVDVNRLAHEVRNIIIDH